MNYESIIGLEIHAQLKTESKMFCSCLNTQTSADEEANRRTCPICMGMPGVLPVINKKALEMMYLLGLALNCQVADQFNFERKQYFYPDLPKGYQITSQTTPPLIGGYLELDIEGEKKKFTIEHVHIEEDAGKLIHSKDGYSLVDLNRAGTPLLEIVTNPDFRSPREAKAFMQELRLILRYLNISDADMEKGQLRCDANISLREKGKEKLGKKVEVKNMNSFVALEKALIYEIGRQKEILQDRGKIEQETRGWDENKEITVAQRTKEYAHDYRYFPEPDLPPIVIRIKNQESRSKNQESRIKKQEYYIDIEELKKQIPELPAEKRERYVKDFDLDKKDVDILVSDRDLAYFFEEAVQNQEKKIIKKIANWVLGEVLRYLKDHHITINNFPISPENLRELVKIIEKGEITATIGKEVLTKMIKHNKTAREIIDLEGIKQVSDKKELEKIIEKIIKENPQAVSDYQKGKKEAIGFLIGQIMKETRGQANAEIVRKTLEEVLE